MRLKQRDTASGARGVRRSSTETERGLDGASGKKMGKCGGDDASAGLGGSDALLDRGVGGGLGRDRHRGRRGTIGWRAGALGAAAAIRRRGRAELKRRETRRKSAGQSEDEGEDAAEHIEVERGENRAKGKRFLASGDRGLAERAEHRIEGQYFRGGCELFVLEHLFGDHAAAAALLNSQHRNGGTDKR